MAKVEVDEDALKQLSSTAALLAKLNADPKSRKHLEASIKIHHPEVETEEDVRDRLAAPYAEQIKALEAKLAETTKLFTEDRDSRQARQAEIDTDAAFADLRAKGYTDEGIGEIKKIMVDRKCADPIVAASYFDYTHPPAAHESASWEPQTWELPTAGGGMTDDSMKLLLNNEDAWADREIGAALKDVRRAA
ncbi:MAG: hypothetical protein KGL39_39095 [Patescibacteria group bacterium]|nr:hypothetical protein [Patescibacteria group bacterium]